ncbi:MAG: hypothetical protein LUC43_09965 [Burkholderiales bacterium]|nr:hypothetical protein [Burkholderiales bacterium]
MSDDIDDLEAFRAQAMELVDRSFFDENQKKVLSCILETSIPVEADGAASVLSPEKIAEKVGLSLEEVWDALHLFEEMGVLEIGDRWRTVH